MAKPKEKPGLMMYWSMFDVLESLMDGQAKTMLQAIRQYSQYGVVPEFSGDALLSTLWMLIRPQIDTDTERYEKIKSDNVVKGWTSYFKKHYALAHGIDPDDKNALQKYIDERMEELTEDNNSQPLLTVVDNGQPIPVPIPVPVSMTVPIPDNDGGIMLNEEMENVQPLARPKPEFECGSDEFQFEEKRQRAIDSLAAYST